MKKLLALAKMNKSDIILLLVTLLAAGCLYAGLFFINLADDAKEKIAIVYYQNKEVMRLDLKIDSTYYYEATLGTVTIEVKDGAVRVEKETSPYHYCSLQGWVKNSTEPIVCLPNDLLITIQGYDEGNDFDLK